MAGPVTPAVLDASAAVRIFVPTAETPEILAASRSRSLISPSLILAEMANAFWKYIRAEKMRIAAAQEALAAIADLTAIVADDGLASRALRIARRLDHPVYDCFYLALAEQISAPLLTADRRLRKHAETMGVGALPALTGTGEDPTP